MKTLISILVLSLFVSISADARGPKGGKSIFNKWSPYSLKERLPLLPFKEEDVWKMDKDQYRLTTPIIPDYCKNLEDKDLEKKWLKWLFGNTNRAKKLHCLVKLDQEIFPLLKFLSP